MMQVVRHSTAASFLARARDWLLRREAEHNLLLGLATQLARGGDGHYQQPIYLATVEENGAVAGCAFRTPPFKLGITRVPADALSLLAEDLAAVYDSIPAILGPEPEAMELGRLWTARRGGRVVRGRPQRIHQASSVVLPASPARGMLRLAAPSDRDLVTRWAGGFARDASLPELEPAVLGRRLIDERSLYLWEDGAPRSMVAAMAPTPNGIRISYVYTPPEHRGRGYASVAVGTLTRRLLEGGRKFCFLYTDLANAISNAIYARLGYERVCDVVDVAIETGSAGSEPTG